MQHFISEESEKIRAAALRGFPCSGARRANLVSVPRSGPSMADVSMMEARGRAAAPKKDQNKAGLKGYPELIWEFAKSSLLI